MYSSVIVHDVFNGLEKYFKILSKTGYVKYQSVGKLLALSLVECFLNSELNTFITEEDYNIISRFLYCIYGRDCLVPYPKFVSQEPQVGTILPNNGGFQPFRITESGAYRPIYDRSRNTEYRTDFWEE